MTQAYNLSQLANNLNTAGQLDATDGLVNAVPVANGGTGASDAATARTNLSVPSTTGGGASGTWGIDITGNAATATSATTAATATYATTAGNGGVTSVNGATGAVTVIGAGARTQVFTSSGTFTVPAGVTSLEVEVYGGGAGGAGASGSGGVSPTGGAGGYGRTILSGLTPGASITVTIGAGGAGSSGSVGTGSAGANGGTTTFGTYATATGGSGLAPNSVPTYFGNSGTFSTTGTLVRQGGGIGNLLYFGGGTGGVIVYW